MKKIKLTLLLIPILSLVSCENSKSSIYKINDYDLIIDNTKTTLTVDLTTQELINLLENDASFPLFFHSNICSSCQIVEQYVNRYVLNTKSVIYSYEYSSKYNEYALLNAFNPNLFPERIVTPRFLFLKDGELSIEVNEAKFSSYDLFSKSLNAFLNNSNIYSLTTSNSHSSFIDQYDEYLLFTYNREFSKSIDIFYEYIYQNANKKKTPILTIDVSNLSTNDYNYFNEYYSLNSIDNILIIVNGQNNFISTNYENDLNSFVTILSNYFE